jgi:ribonuclease R
MERRAVKGITIDSSSTRDIDDALWIEFNADGHWHIFVSIADVSEAVSPGGKIDTRAREMVTTKYYATGNSPMLPRRFAEDELSLWPDKERKTVTVDITVKSPEMEIVKTEIYPTTLTSLGRITYDQIPAMLKDKPKIPVYDVIDIGCKMAMQLLDRRRKAGAFVLYDLNNGWITTEEGFLRKLEKKEETVGYILIQEMMVLANAQVAAFAVKNDIPVLFRNHVAMSAMPDRQILMAQIQDALTTPMADLDVVRQRTHLLLGRASYSDSLLGHYGLNLPAYLHFTSPIRRYADLVTHRQIKAFLAGQPLPYTKKDVESTATHINDTLELEREHASMHFKTKAEEKAHRDIDARRLDGLDAVHFERVTKVEARSGYDPSDAFEEAYLRRLKENRLPLICLTVILTQEGYTEGWKPIVQATIDHLAKRPEDAISILSQSQQIAGWAETKFTTTHEGPDHARTFTCTATLQWDENTSVSRLGRASTSKLAKYHAAVALLAALHGAKVPEKTPAPGGPSSYVAKEHEVVRMAVAMPDKGLVAGSTVCVVHVFPDAYEVEAITVNGRETITVSRDSVMPLSAPVPAENQIPSSPVPDITSGKDPVSALMEFAQKTKTPPPDFQFDKTGPDHIPTITCTCSLKVPGRERITKKATASSKQDAKKQAAREVLSALAV